MRKISMSLVIAVLTATCLLSGCITTPNSPGVSQDVKKNAYSHKETTVYEPSALTQTSTSSLWTLNVHAKHTVKVVPDVADITLTATSEGKTAKEAQQRNTDRVNNAINAIRNTAGVDESGIQTSSINVWPEYALRDTGKPEVTSYKAETTITISGVEIDRIGDVVNSSIAAGINGVNGVQFRFSKYAETYREALAEAINAAREKAEVMAKAADCELGRVISINEGYENDFNSFSKFANSVSFDSATNDEDVSEEVMAGEVEVSASVDVSFILK